MNLPLDQKRKPFRAASFSMTFSKTCRAILIGAVSLCFAGFAGMAPSAFAQRGGGGHAGGGHVGGGFHAAGAGFSSGARGSVGSAGRASGSGFRSASGVAVYAHGSTTNRGYGRTYFVAGPGARSGVGASSFVSGSFGAATGARTFAANNRFWQEPPQQGRAAVMPRPFFMPQTRSLGSPWVNPRFANAPGHFTGGRMLNGTPYVGMTPTPSNRFFNNGLGPFFNSGFHPIGPGPCFGGFGGCGFGFGFGTPFFNPFFGFGFNSCFMGGFGCFGFGGFGPFGYGYGNLGWGDMGLYSYGNGWFYPPAEEPPPPPENPTEDNQPPVYAPDYYFMPPPDEVSAAPEQPQQPVVKLVLKDGTIFGVYSYWMQNNQLVYITTYNIKTSIPIEDLDLQKTVDLNGKLGVKFVLSPKPPDQQPPQNDDQQPDQQQ